MTDIDILKEVDSLIEKYHPDHSLDHLSRFLISFSALKHPAVRMHMARVALISNNVAEKIGLDPKPAFFAGLFHDLGKLLLPCELFDGHNITAEEYKRVQEHAELGFKALADHHLYTALCAGLHHAMSKSNGDYGIRLEEIIHTSFKPRTALRILETSLIIAIADFTDAAMSRKTDLKDTSLNGTLRDMLIQKYEPDATRIVDYAIQEGGKIHDIN